jgi:hypothetical protein
MGPIRGDRRLCQRDASRRIAGDLDDFVSSARWWIPLRRSEGIRTKFSADDPSSSGAWR